MSGDIVTKLTRALRTAEEWAGTPKAKEAVKLRPSDWHRVTELAREAAATITAQAQEIERLKLAERERCASMVDEWSKRQTMKLHAGEMTAGEVRTARAILKGIAAAIRKETTA